jgi:hypothetical protein
MTKATALLVLAAVAVSVLVSSAPALIRLAQAAVPLVIAVGTVATVWRVVWYFTRRY